MDKLENDVLSIQLDYFINENNRLSIENGHLKELIEEQRISRQKMIDLINETLNKTHGAEVFRC